VPDPFGNAEGFDLEPFSDADQSRVPYRGAFVRLVLAEGISNVALWFFQVGLIGEATYRFHVGVSGFGILSAVSGVAFILGAGASGPASDGWKAKWVLTSANALVLIAIVVAAFAPSYLYCLVAMFAFSAGDGAMGPSRSVMLPVLINRERFIRSNVLISLAWQISVLVSPAAAGAVLVHWGERDTFLVAACFMVVGLAFFSSLPVTSREQSVARVRVPHEGLRESWRRLEFRYLMAIAFVASVATGALLTLEPLFVRDVLHRGAGTLGMIWSVRGAGGLVGILALLGFVRRDRAEGPLYCISVFGAGAGWMMFASLPMLPLVAIGAFVRGLSTSPMLPLARSAIQRLATHTGRVEGVFATLNQLGSVLAAVILAWLGAEVKAREWLMASALLLIFVGVSGVYVSRRTFHAGAPHRIAG
jgi:predicted MFS family arabinose efflux permease